MSDSLYDLMSSLWLSIFLKKCSAKDFCPISVNSKEAESWCLCPLVWLVFSSNSSSKHLIIILGIHLYYFFMWKTPSHHMNGRANAQQTNSYLHLLICSFRPRCLYLYCLHLWITSLMQDSIEKVLRCVPLQHQNIKTSSFLNIKLKNRCRFVFRSRFIFSFQWS